MKSRWFPRPHNWKIMWGKSIESAVDNHSTMVPIVMYDEGLGAVNSYNSNPEHASFAEAAEPNCYPDSHLQNIICTIDVKLTKGALETDKIHVFKWAFMPIHCAFESDIDAKDEKTGLTVGTILELEKETTDRTVVPLWTGADMTIPVAALGLEPTNVTGLTTDQKQEGVSFDTGTYYDALQYFQNAGKIRACSGGLKWMTLTKNHPHQTIRIRLRSKNKFMNPYNFAAVLFVTPAVDTARQAITAAEVTNIEHIRFSMHIRYNEWHEHFNHVKA